MNFLDILPSIVFYYASVVIQGENCINLGLVSPIEVVEEWACHDTEVRLTCGHLDSKLAILEATFTPNCTNEDCLKLDIKRLAKAFYITSKPPVTISRKEETQAGRKFLEALKNGPRIPDENQEEVVVIDSSDTYTEIESGSSDSLENNLAGVITNQLNARKASLRASLEKLIIRYLRKLSPDENFDYEMHKRSIRYKRNMRRKRVKRLSKQNSTKNSKESIEELNISYDNDFDINFNDTDDQNTTKYDKMVLGKSHLRINLGEHFVVDENFGNKKLEYEQRQQKLKEIRLFCPDQKRKVSSLDRFDIENSYRNESMEDYNIRRLLNRRCSGKNHCSFIFNIDHPFSKVWESGTVRVKYICMDDFRINHYCGEHLEIGYELSSKEQMEQHGSSSINKIGEPIVEARVVRESSAKDHNLAYHSVKILKTDNVLDGLTNLEIQQLSNQNAPPILSPTSISDSRKRKIKIHNAVIEKSEVKDNGVYSRDFKILKIIPSNIDDINDLNRIGDEIYIRKDFEEESSVEKQVAEYYTPLSSANSFVPHSISSTLTTRLETQQHNLLPSVTKPLQTSYSTSEGTTVLHYPAPNYPETPSNKDFDDNSSSIGTEEDINLLYTNNGNVTNFKNYTITIREGDQYVIVFPTIAVPPSKGAFFPPKNLVFGKETFKMKDQYHESLQTTSYVTTTTPFKQVTLNELNETADNIKISKQSNLSKVEKENAFFISSTTTTFDMPAISSAMAIDFSNDLTSSHSTNATTMSTTDLTSSTSSESTEFGTMLSMPQRETTRTTTVGSQQSSSSTYGTSSLEINSTLGYQDISDEKDKIIKIDLPDSTVYEEDVDNSGLSSFEDETDDEYDDIRHLFATRSSYTSIQKTVFRKPLLHGFLMTPGYPKFYIGEINCKWEIHAPEGYKIRLSILDISLRDAEPFCKDYLEITDQVTSKTLLNSCAEEIRPVEIITNSHQVNVIVKTTTKFAYPKRGVLLHYSALGCIDPPLPTDVNLVKKTETTNFYKCREGYVFVDTLSNSRLLVCTERHTWSSILPDCIEELVIAQSGFIIDSYNINSRKRPPEKEKNGDVDGELYVHPNSFKNINIKINSTIMPDKDADMVFDIIIPTLLIAGLLIINGFVFAVIIHFRKRSKTLEGNNVELAEL